MNHIGILFLALGLTITSSLQEETDINKEAAKQATQQMNSRFLGTCKKDFAFTQKRRKSTAMPNGFTFVWQFKNPHWEVKSAPLTEADRLNEIEWKGVILLRASAYRKHTYLVSLLSDKTTNQWGEWYELDSPIKFLFEKKKGTWNVYEQEGGWSEFPVGVAPKCDEVEKLLVEKKGD